MTNANRFRVHPQPESKVKRFIPFSDGRRDCIGQALAKTNYTAVLALLLGRFHFELAPEVRQTFAQCHNMLMPCCCRRIVSISALQSNRA